MSIVAGKVKVIGPTKEVGKNDYAIRNLVIETEEQYPQFIEVQFGGHNVDFLDPLHLGQYVKVTYDLKGRKWVDAQGQTKYFNTIKGYKIENV